MKNNYKKKSGNILKNCGKDSYMLKFSKFYFQNIIFKKLKRLIVFKKNEIFEKRLIIIKKTKFSKKILEKIKIKLLTF